MSRPPVVRESRTWNPRRSTTLELLLSCESGIIVDIFGMEFSNFGLSFPIDSDHWWLIIAKQIWGIYLSAEFARSDFRNPNISPTRLSGYSPDRAYFNDLSLLVNLDQERPTPRVERVRSVTDTSGTPNLPELRSQGITLTLQPTLLWPRPSL